MKKITGGLLPFVLTVSCLLSVSIGVAAAPNQNNASGDQEAFLFKKDPKKAPTPGNQGPNNNWNGPAKPNSPGNQGSWLGNQGPQKSWNNQPNDNGPAKKGPFPGNQGPNNNWNSPAKPNSPGNQGSWLGNQGPQKNGNNQPNYGGPQKGPFPGNQGPHNNWNGPAKPNGSGSQGSWLGNQGSGNGQPHGYQPAPTEPWAGKHGPNNNWKGQPHPGAWGDQGPWKNHHGSGYYRPLPQQNGPVAQLQYNASAVIHRTALIVEDAQRAAQSGPYSYGLGKAIAHQQAARELYWKGAYRDAIFHSLRARDLAIQVLNGNHEALSWNYSRDEMEDSYCQQAPRDEDLDRQLNLETILTDLAALFLHLDIDIQF